MELCSFLVAECKAEFSLDKYDDPNTSVNKLLLVLKSVDIEVDFPASKIKQGYGDAVCITLQKLCNKVGAAFEFKFFFKLWIGAQGEWVFVGKARVSERGIC